MYRATAVEKYMAQYRPKNLAKWSKLHAPENQVDNQSVQTLCALSEWMVPHLTSKMEEKLADLVEQGRVLSALAKQSRKDKLTKQKQAARNSIKQNAENRKPPPAGNRADPQLKEELGKMSTELPVEEQEQYARAPIKKVKLRKTKRVAKVYRCT